MDSTAAGMDVLLSIDGNRAKIWKAMTEEEEQDQAESSAFLSIHFSATSRTAKESCSTKVLDHGVSLYFDVASRKLRLIQIPTVLFDDGVLPSVIKTTYSSDVDALYLYFKKDTAVKKTLSFRDYLMLDFDANQKLVGLEIISLHLLLHLNVESPMTSPRAAAQTI